MRRLWRCSTGCPNHLSETFASCSFDNGQTHDIKNLFISDGSQFTTSAAENPTLTIVTLAIRQADYIADQCTKKNI
jgi:choline dehydrogenase-like flavoprotein